MRIGRRALFVLCFSGPAAAATFTVDPGGGADFTRIQDAIDASVDGDVVTVAPGTYAEALDFGGRGITVASTDGAASTIVDGGGATTNLVTFATGETSDAVLQGFTLRNGTERAVYVSGAGPTLTELVVDEAGDYDDGAGIYVTAGTPNLVDVTLTGLTGTSGVALYLDATSDVVAIGCTVADMVGSYAAVQVDGGTLTLTDSTISGNWSRYYGALTVLAGGTAVVTDTDFSTNRGDYNPGAAILVEGGSTLAVSGGTFAWNWADYGTYYGYTGGAVLVHGSTATIDGATFTRNAAGYGSGAAVRSGGSLTVTGSTFEHNTGYGGRGLAATSSATLVVTGSTFTEDSTWPATGGAVYATSAASLTLDDNVFCGSLATDGGAVWVSGGGATSLVGNTFLENTATGTGGAVYLASVPSPTLRDNTFAGNEAPTAGAVYLTGTTPTFTNNLLAWTVAGDGFYDASGDAAAGTLTYNLWYANTTSDVGGALTTGDLGTGNVFADPTFADFALDGACGDDLTLLAGSPALDAGDPALSDADGSASDIGAHGPSTAVPDTGDTGDTADTSPDTDTGASPDTADTGASPDTADTGPDTDTDTADTDTDTADTDTGAEQPPEGCGGCATTNPAAGLAALAFAALATTRRRMLRQPETRPTP